MISSSGGDDAKIKCGVSNVEYHAKIKFECIKVHEGHSDNIYCLELNSNDSFLSFSEHQTVKLWQIDPGELLNSIEYDQPVNNVKRLTEDLIAIALENGEIQIYALNKMKNVQAHSSHFFFTKFNRKLIEFFMISLPNKLFFLSFSFMFGIVSFCISLFQFFDIFLFYF